MSYAYGSLALELYRPTIARYAPIVGAVFLLGVFLAAWTVGGDGPGSAEHTVRIEAGALDSMTVKAGKLDVPVYYFPDMAIGTDHYVEARDGNCGGAANAASADFPQGWLKP